MLQLQGTRCGFPKCFWKMLIFEIGRKNRLLTCLSRMWLCSFFQTIRLLFFQSHIWLPPEMSYKPKIVQKKSRVFSCSCRIKNGSFWSRIWQLNDILFFFFNFARRLKVSLVFALGSEKFPFWIIQLHEKTCLFFLD